MYSLDLGQLVALSSVNLRHMKAVVWPTSRLATLILAFFPAALAPLSLRQAGTKYRGEFEDRLEPLTGMSCREIFDRCPRDNADIGLASSSWLRLVALSLAAMIRSVENRAASNSPLSQTSHHRSPASAIVFSLFFQGLKKVINEVTSDERDVCLFIDESGP